jgi:formate-dependent phosphoribosylglycinamide formyltransferase (GAR transformylase)
MAGEVLFQLETGSRRECRVVMGLPTDETVRLTVAAASSAAARTQSDAGALFDAIANALRG